VKSPIVLDEVFDPQGNGLCPGVELPSPARTCNCLFI